MRVKNKLIYCGNVNGTCTVLDIKKFHDQEHAGEDYDHLVSELTGYPSFIKVLSIKDSINQQHDILFTAKTALKGSGQKTFRKFQNLHEKATDEKINLC